MTDVGQLVHVVALPLQLPHEGEQVWHDCASSSNMPSGQAARHEPSSKYGVSLEQLVQSVAPSPAQLSPQEAWQASHVPPALT